MQKLQFCNIINSSWQNEYYYESFLVVSDEET